MSKIIQCDCKGNCSYLINNLGLCDCNSSCDYKKYVPKKRNNVNRKYDVYICTKIK